MHAAWHPHTQSGQKLQHWRHQDTLTLTKIWTAAAEIKHAIIISLGLRWAVLDSSRVDYRLGEVWLGPLTGSLGETM